MTGPGEIWRILSVYAPKRRWISIGEVFTIVESRSTLDSEDLRLGNSLTPKWKLNVRRVLQTKKRKGVIQGRQKLN